MVQTIRLCFLKTLLMSIAFLFMSTVSPTPVLAQKKDGGEVIGKIWSMTVKKAEGKVNVKEAEPLKIMNSKLRVRGYNIFGLGGKQIGTYKINKPEQMTVTFTDNQFKGYVVDMSLTLREPQTWRGFGKKEGEDRLWFQFVFEKD